MDNFKNALSLLEEFLVPFGGVCFSTGCANHTGILYAPLSSFTEPLAMLKTPKSFSGEVASI